MACIKDSASCNPQTNAGLAIGNEEGKGWAIVGVGEAEAAAAATSMATFANDPGGSETVESRRRSLKRSGKVECGWEVSVLREDDTSWSGTRAGEADNWHVQTETSPRR